MSQQLKIAIGIPAYGGKCAAEHSRMWLELGNAIGGNEKRFRLVMMGTVDTQPVDRARNLLIAQAMLHQADWLFMVDADTWVERVGDEDAGFQICRMISDADRVGCTLVSAAVVLRGKDPNDQTHKLAVYKRSVVETAIKHEAQPIDWIHEQRRALVPVDAVGAACFALNLKKLAEIDPPLMFEFKPPLSEDLNFCKALGEADHKVMVDPRVLTAHLSKPAVLSVRG